jgi:hypothetical protein
MDGGEEEMNVRVKGIEYLCRFAFRDKKEDTKDKETRAPVCV